MTENTGSRWRMTLLGSFDVMRDDVPLPGLPLGAQRVLAMVALEGAPIHRRVAAEGLWPDSTVKRASANLRSALWQCSKSTAGEIIECSGPRLALARCVHVDVLVTQAESRRLQDDETGSSTLSPLFVSLSRRLLPDWGDEWLIPRRECWEQFRLHTLEKLARRSISTGDFALAAEAALAAVAIEPVRETAHRILMESYIAEGNGGCAVKHFDRYRRMLERELGVSPSRRMARLVQDLQKA